MQQPKPYEGKDQVVEQPADANEAEYQTMVATKEQIVEGMIVRVMHADSTWHAVFIGQWEERISMATLVYFDNTSDDAEIPDDMILRVEEDGYVESTLMDGGGSMNAPKASAVPKPEAPKSTGLLAAIQSGGGGAGVGVVTAAAGGEEGGGTGLDDDMETSMI